MLVNPLLPPNAQISIYTLGGTTVPTHTTPPIPNELMNQIDLGDLKKKPKKTHPTQYLNYVPETITVSKNGTNLSD